jgi:hypothetical protein
MGSYRIYGFNLFTFTNRTETEIILEIVCIFVNSAKRKILNVKLQNIFCQIL